MENKEHGPRQPHESVSTLSTSEDDIYEAGVSVIDIEKQEEPLGDGAVDTSAEPIAKAVSVNNSSAIPNGGLRAWLQVVGSFFLFFNSWGIINAFGVFQTYYETSLLTSSSASNISWIGSIQAFLLMFVSALAGPVYDAGYFRELLLAGTLLVAFGMMMLSLCTQYWQVLLAQGFCVGIGCGCLFVPSVAILSSYFTTRIATAMGIAASGSSLGGVLYPITFHKLQPHLGFAWTTRIISFISLGTLLLPNIVMKLRALPSTRRAMLDLRAFREAPYSLFVLGGFLGFMGLYAPFFYIQLYSIEKGITDPNLAFYLLSILNAASIFGRLFPNLAADRVGPLNVIVPCALITGLLSLALIPVNSLAGLVVVAALYGFFSGTFVSLPPTVLVSLSPSRGVVGTRMGMCFAVVSVGLVIGTPIAGAILGASDFASVWIFGGVLAIIGGLIMGIARGCKVGWSLATKA